VVGYAKTSCGGAGCRRDVWALYVQELSPSGDHDFGIMKAHEMHYRVGVGIKRRGMALEAMNVSKLAVQCILLAHPVVHLV
jgi:hypothetical protein